VPFHFRRSLRIAPGIRLNLSKSGVSTSVGARGAHVTLGNGRVWTTVGLPAIGLSYTESTSTRMRQSQSQRPSQLPSRPSDAPTPVWWLVIALTACGIAWLLAG
jgi:hypothetical protein